MANYLLALCSIFAVCVGTVAVLTCNTTRLELGDPMTYQQAIIDTIRCLISTNQELNKNVLDNNLEHHRETLQVLRDMSTAPQANGWIYYFTSFLISTFTLYVIHQLVRTMKYLVLMRSDGLVRLAITGKRIVRLNLEPPTTQDIMDFRSNLSKPCLAYCCNVRSIAQELEMI